MLHYIRPDKTVRAWDRAFVFNSRASLTRLKEARLPVRGSHETERLSQRLGLSISDFAGAPGTSAVNLTCTANTVASDRTRSRQYRVSLRCTWLAGEASPEDTRYFLYYRFGPIFTYADG